MGVWRPRGRSGSDRGAQEREEREVHPRRAGWLNSARSHGCLLAAPREIIGYNRGRGGDACPRCEMASNQPLRHSNSFYHRRSKLGRCADRTTQATLGEPRSF